MVRAAVRLHERMAFAFARGSLADYLRKIGMAEELGLGPQHNANLAKVEDAAILLLAQKIRRARKSGTLKSYLRQINMLELLQKEARPGKIGHNVAHLHRLQATGKKQDECVRPIMGNVIAGPFRSVP
ncbi:hypothetical protein [Mitsuokella multacida]|uniref:hypothetical protein n=1 Tax=Mitsuokella multacida TaxID=52226 RepID=UPI0022E70F0F|nr:hypothetical protein [Mitsuokella multacida]